MDDYVSAFGNFLKLKL